MLNKSIYAYTTQKADILWNIIAGSFSDEKSDENRNTLHIIVDGSFEKLCRTGLKPDTVIERLVNLLW